MSKASEIGKNGEELAATYLMHNGYTIIDRNWNLHRGYELDIVALNSTGDTVVFVEVKTRYSNAVSEPEDAVDEKKMRRICMAANHYVCEKQIDKYYRFDIISVIYKSESDYTLKHIENAFDVPLTTIGSRW